LLLQKLGVKGTDEQLDRITRDWNGHALTLSLIGSYLVKQHKGNASKVSDFDIEEDKVEGAVPNQYRHVGSILRSYDEYLTKEEKAFLVLFSAFRTPVHVSAFDKVFRIKTDVTTLNASLTDLSDEEFGALVDRLVNYRILRFDKQNQTYTTHPLIRNHYFALLTRGNVQHEDAQCAHEIIKDYYLSIAGYMPQYPTLDDLKSLIEVVHHACQAGAYDEAFKIFLDRIQQGRRAVLMHQLGAYETNLNVMLEFVEDGDSAKEPQTSEPNYNRFILNACARLLHSLSAKIKMR
jgi:hypothetical protein